MSKQSDVLQVFNLKPSKHKWQTRTWLPRSPSGCLHGIMCDYAQQFQSPFPSVGLLAVIACKIACCKAAKILLIHMCCNFCVPCPIFRAGLCSENEPPSSSGGLLHESSADSSKPAGAKRKLVKAGGASATAAGRGTGRTTGEWRTFVLPAGKTSLCKAASSAVARRTHQAS